MDYIKEIVVDGNETYDFVNSVITNNEAEDIEFRNCDFLNDDMLELINNREYERIAFVNCSFDDYKLLSSLRTKSLSFTDSKLNDYEFIYNMSSLENLTIVGGMVDVSQFDSLKKLQYLRLSHSFVDNIEKYISPNLKYLFIDNTNIKDVSFIKKFPNLELLSVSEEQVIHNKELIKELSKYIKIICDSIIEMGVYLDD